MKRLALIILLTLALVPLNGVSAQENVSVVATIAPIGSIVQEAFPGVRVEVIIPPGVDPHDYQLTAQQVELLSKAQVIVTTGGHLPVEKRIAELEKEGTVTGKALFIDDYMKYGFHYAKEHWYNGKDNPHGVWLDPYNAIAIAEATKEALIEEDPANAMTYERDFERFRERVLAIVEAYKALAPKNATAVIQMPPDEYAIDWLGIKAVAAIKPEEEVPAIGVDQLVPTAEKSSLIVYGSDSPEQLKKASIELAQKSGKPLAEITVFWASGNYTDWLIKNTASIMKALSTPQKTAEKNTRDNTVVTYALLALITGVVLGTALGVILKK
ncbi:ABC-type metal ion transport system, periplasmic component/surface adhesin [Thermococcus nautili]|uniref:metal ABC transporter solute-binding protein, Zn/Mn family n=1 Tax=Thermococcus nautili TaxID=195522 RepID=UPI00255767C8|nr:zinc ABC transporter substrate-binding protein [Thermococcus nautili]CAI1493557.1 ABC-type metal ion transport system, periplasmic component/surface adhesin [Thermococcus nautili]